MRMKTSMVDSIWAPTCLLHISNKFTFLSKKFHSIRCSHMMLLLLLLLLWPPASVAVPPRLLLPH